MAATTNVPEKLKPYVCHGVYLNIPVQSLDGVGSVSGDCPWCGKEGKFNVTLLGEKAGMWRCVVCNTGSVKGGGNVYTFLRCLHDLSMKATVEHDYKGLAQQRHLLYTDTLRAWGVCKSVIDGTWLIPAYSVGGGGKEGGKLIQLYRYVRLEGRMTLLATAGLPQGLHGPELPTPVGGVQTTKRGPKTGPVYRLEGPWDGMAFYEVALRCKVNEEGGLSPTGNSDASLLSSGTVIAVPGCGTFFPAWANVSSGRPDYSFYDNDHPKEHPPGTGKMIQPGLDGTRRAIDVLVKASAPPRELKYLRWGQTSYHEPALPTGYDVRDALAGKEGTHPLLQRIREMQNLLGRLQSPPQEWIPGVETTTAGGVSLSIRQEECRDWKTLMSAFRDVLKPTPALIRAFASGFASILSVPSIGDQLWLMVVGPPSSAKSTLCELWSTNRHYVLPKDTLTGLFSGWQMGLEKDENLSLAGEMMNKTLVIKDADTVLQSPQCNQIMSQLRALYDRAVRVQFKNRMSKDWEGMNSTVILCGTATLYELDASEKGARYLTVDIQPENDYDLEDEITLRIAHRAFRNMTLHANGTAESRDTPEMTRLKQLTAGYISYLRDNATALVEAVEDPSGDSLMLCGHLAQFVSYMRCRPPKKQTEKVEREMPYRLTSQLVRLARGLAVVFNKRSMDKEVMEHVRHIALNTAQGKVLRICDHVRAAGRGGVIHNLLAQFVGETPEETMSMLRFLRRIHAVELIQPAQGGVVKGGRPRWRLAPRLSSLYDRIFGATATAGIADPSLME